MSVAEATPDFEQGTHDDRAFLGHPKGLGFLGFTEACERFSYYSMQTLLTLYMVNYLLLAGHIEKVTGLAWLRSWHYPGLDGQPLSSAIFGDYTSLVYLMPILGGIIADKLTGRRIALIAGALVMALGHFLMAFEGAFLFALLALIVGVGLFKGNIATQVGELYTERDLRRAMAFQIFYIFINVSVIAAPLISGTLGQEVGWDYGFGCAGVVMVLGLFIYLSGRKWLPADLAAADRDRNQLIGRVIAGAVGIAALVLVWLLISGILFASWLVGTISALVMVGILYWFLTRNLNRADRFSVLTLCILIPVMADLVAYQSGDFQRLPRLGRPAVQPRLHGQDAPKQLAHHARCDFELLDAGGRRGFLEMVEPQAPRARRDQQDDHRQRVHDCRRRGACLWPP